MTRPREQCGSCYDGVLRQDEAPCDWCRMRAIDQVRRFFDASTNEQVTDEQILATVDWFRGDSHRYVLAARSIVRSRTADSGRTGESHRVPGETPFCAGRNSATHAPTAMHPNFDGWECQVCGELWPLEDAENARDAESFSVPTTEVGQ